MANQSRPPTLQRGVSTVQQQKAGSPTSTGRPPFQRAVSTLSRSSGKEGPPSVQWQSSLQQQQQPPVSPWRRVLSVFGHIVIVLVLAAYTAAGGIAFVYLERPNEVQTHEDVRMTVSQSKTVFIGKVWNYTKAHVLRSCTDVDVQVARRNIEALMTEELRNYDGIIYGAADEGVNVHEEPDYSWNYPRAMFFSATVITTIGYGNIAPVTTGGRIFCIIYALFGIPLTLIAIADMGKLFAKLLKYVYKKIKKRMTKPKKVEAVEDEAALAAAAAGPSKYMTSLKVFGALLLLILYIALGAAIFIIWEKWSFFESFYFCFITMTTIGLGDLVPEHQMFMLLCTAYILIGLAITSTCIELARSEYEKSWQRMVEASKKLQGLSGISLADTLKRIGDQIELHGEIVDLSLLKDLKSAIIGSAFDDKDNGKPPPIIIYETTV